MIIHFKIFATIFLLEGMHASLMNQMDDGTKTVITHDRSLNCIKSNNEAENLHVEQ